MSDPIDYSILDNPQILRFVFYPRRDWTEPPPGATDYLVPVDKAVSVSCRFYAPDKSWPSILFFHGNGEVACDYDGFAPLYHERNINLFVADYRGYGLSDGNPSFANTVADARIIFDFCRNTLREAGFSGQLYIMGRSLGSLPAVELCSSYAGHVPGLIIESGFTSAGRLLHYLGFPLQAPQVNSFETAVMDRIRSLFLPLLIIHGDYDDIIPYEQAQIFYREAGSKQKKLLTIRGAGHNDLMLIGMEQYFSAIKDFVYRT